jgi:hypothetical protein
MATTTVQHDRPYLVPFPAPPEADAAPGGVLAGLATAHGAGTGVVEDYITAERKLAGDAMLSDQGKASAARETVASLEARLDKFGPHIETADKKLGEGRAALMRKAMKPFDVQRSLGIAGWLRDTKPEERGRVISRAIQLGDLETITAALTAPAIWEIFLDPRWRERATKALLESSDPAALAELDRLSLAIQSVKEAHLGARTWIRKRAGIASNIDLNKKENTNAN